MNEKQYLSLLQGLPDILQGIPVNSFVTRYLPPFDEFEVDRCILPRGESTVFPAVPGPSILKGDVVTEGDVVFAPANTEISITSASELQLYRAGVNSRAFQYKSAFLL
jgi:mannose-6-phosphate isomerase